MIISRARRGTGCWVCYGLGALGRRYAPTAERRTSGLYAALLPESERVLGPEHPDTLRTRARLGNWTAEAGGFGQRPRHLRRTLLRRGSPVAARIAHLARELAGRSPAAFAGLGFHAWAVAARSLRVALTTGQHMSTVSESGEPPIRT